MDEKKRLELFDDGSLVAIHGFCIVPKTTFCCCREGEVAKSIKRIIKSGMMRVICSKGLDKQ